MAADAAPPDLDAAAGAVAATERWCRWIADVKLCPWAKKSLETPAACKFAVSDAETPGAFAADVVAASRRAAASAADASAGIAFVVAPKFLPDDFEAFAAFLEELEDDVVPGAVPDVQVAGFHPAWTFAGLDDDDPLRGRGALFLFLRNARPTPRRHFEKRAPHPTVSVVKFAGLDGADSARIGDDNAATLERLGHDALRAAFAGFARRRP